MARDAYEVLGVSMNAQAPEIKAAYRQLVKEVHPDLYQDVRKKRQMEKRLSEINRAYDTLLPSPAAYGSLADASALLGQNRVAEAKKILEILPDENGQWHYLYGLCMLRYGMHNQAREHMKRATTLEPKNAEFARGALVVQAAMKKRGLGGTLGRAWNRILRTLKGSR